MSWNNDAGTGKKLVGVLPQSNFLLMGRVKKLTHRRRLEKVADALEARVKASCGAWRR